MQDLYRRWALTVPDLEYEELVRHFNRIYTITNVPKLRSFQYRILSKALITNVQLKHFNIRTDNLCTFCLTETETVSHLFVDCKYVICLWNQVIDSFSNLTITRDAKSIIFNNVTNNAKHLENFIVLLVKHYIYRVRCEDEKLNVIQLKRYINQIRELEFQIAFKNGKKNLHKQKWSQID